MTKVGAGNAPEWTVSGGDYVPAGFVPRGRVWPANRWLHMLLTLTLIDVFFIINCQRMRGTVSRLDRKNLPKSWLKIHGNVAPSIGGYSTKRYALVWLAEHGDTVIGYAFTSILHDAKVGDEVTVRVKPNSGSIRRLTNHTRPRRWWQY